MYRDLDANLKVMLRNMCNWGFVYIGRTGVGLTYSFKREYYQRSGKALEEAHRWLSEAEVEILTVVAFEGPKWVPYTRIEEIAYKTTTRTTNAPCRAYGATKPKRRAEEKIA